MLRMKGEKVTGIEDWEKDLYKKNFLNISEDQFDIPIYRVIQIEHFFSMITEHENVLVKPSMWDDPFENLILRGVGQVQNGVFADLDEIREIFYGQCWTLERESDAIWRLYVEPENDGIKIKTTIQKLFHSLYDFFPEPQGLVRAFIGRVEYLNYHEIVTRLEYYRDNSIFTDLSTRKIVKTLLFKRDAFKHEREVRLIYEKEYPDYSNDLFRYEIDWKDLIEEIEFDPRMEVEIYEEYRQILIELGFDRDIISRSILYDSPPLLVIKI